MPAETALLQLPLRLTAELSKARACLSEEGMVGLVRAARTFGVYHLRDKWHFVYLEFSLNEKIAVIEDPEVKVRQATPADSEQIRQDIFPHLREEHAYERRYFDRLGENDAHCFLAESDGAIIHYAWVFTDVFRSPMMEVPFDRRRMGANDAYVGPVFTVPGARGMTYLYVLPVLLGYLRDAGVGRALVLVDGRNPAAVAFYRRFGFSIVAGSQPTAGVAGMWQRMVVGRVNR